jgi:hypothetical protein
MSDKPRTARTSMYFPPIYFAWVKLIQAYMKHTTYAQPSESEAVRAAIAAYVEGIEQEDSEWYEEYIAKQEQQS